MTEAFLIAIPSWAQRGMVFLPDIVFLEFIPYADVLKLQDDPAYNPSTLLMDELQVGELYEVVLTHFYGMPLLRYRTGDLVRPVAVSGEDPRHFALQGGIIGRADDMVVVRGVNIYPSAIEAVVRSVDGISEYQVEVDERGAMPEIRLQIENSSGNPAEGALERKLREVFSSQTPFPTINSQGAFFLVFGKKQNGWQKIICRRKSHFTTESIEQREVLEMHIRISGQKAEHSQFKEAQCIE